MCRLLEVELKSPGWRGSQNKCFAHVSRVAREMNFMCANIPIVVLLVHETCGCASCQPSRHVIALPRSRAKCPQLAIRQCALVTLRSPAGRAMAGHATFNVGIEAAVPRQQEQLATTTFSGDQLAPRAFPRALIDLANGGASFAWLWIHSDR